MLVSTTTEWSATFERVAEAGGDDIYFRLDYSQLYTHPDGRPEAFVFEQGPDVFVLPYILRPIESTVLDSVAFDFESAYGYGGPLATTCNPAFLAQAWESFRDLCFERGIVAGFLRFHPLLDNQHFAEHGLVNVVRDRQTVATSLDKTPEEVWHDYFSDTRNKVRKSQKLGVTVQPATGLEVLLAFYRIYEQHMEELEAYSSYFFGEDYFRAIHMLGEDSYRVYLARLDNEVLGGALVLLSPRFAHYHLSSSAKRYNAYAPNVMLRHAVTYDLLGSGRRLLNHGGGRTSDPEDSLLRFKSGFSPERRTFHFGTFIGNEENYRRLCDHWSLSHPELMQRFGARFLRYRFQ